MIYPCKYYHGKRGNCEHMEKHMKCKYLHVPEFKNKEIPFVKLTMI